MPTLNRKRADRLARLAGNQPKECWRNAMLALPTCGDPEAVYVEGWLIIHPGIVIEHGWLESRGEILDPTLHHCADLAAEQRAAELERERDGLRASLLELKTALGTVRAVMNREQANEFLAIFDRADAALAGAAGDGEGEQK